MTEGKPLETVYEGSVKRVHQAPSRADRLWFEFTDDYSVFDWGKMPDKIANKGRALALIGAYLFDRLARPELWKSLPNSPHLQKFDRDWLQQRFNHSVFDTLTKEGAHHTFCSLVQDGIKVKDLVQSVVSQSPLYFEVLAAEVNRPSTHQICNQTIYLYYDAIMSAELQPDQLRMLPLEIVFRFGMPAGSSLSERLQRDPTYAQTLGIKTVPGSDMFAHPVLEFYTKLEPKDRLLSWQEAVHISGLKGPEFENLVEVAFDVGLALHALFADRLLELWDGKLEMAVEGHKLLLADSIGPDELRLIYQGCQLSKEMIRQMYRGSAWEKSLKEAQELARQDMCGRSWKEIARQDLKLEPDPLPPTFKALVDRVYGVLANQLLGGPIFTDHPTIDGFVRSLPTYLSSAPPRMAPLVAPAAKSEE